MTQDMELLIEVQLKNNTLHRAIIDNFIIMGAFCRAHRFSISDVSAIIRLKKPPFLEDGQLRKPALRMVEVLEIDLEKLFPRWLYQIHFKKVVFGIPEEELMNEKILTSLDVIKKLGKLKSGFVIEEWA